MSQKPVMPGLPPGMPDPEAIFQSWWPIIIAVVAGVVYALRQYFRGARCLSKLKLDDKVAIVTGGNTGIGKHVAEDLAKRGARVYLACRDEKTGAVTAEELAKKTNNEKIRCFKCDLASFKSIQNFVDVFKKKEESLHYLVNNAGEMMCEESLTEDKFEHQFQVNYLGAMLLTHLLLDTMKKSRPARVVNTTAAAYQLGEIHLDDVNFNSRQYHAGQAYSQSKLALMLFTKEFVKRHDFEDVGVTMNIVNPGVCNTGIHRNMPFRKSAFISLTFSPFLWFMMKTADDGAQATIFCCLAEGLESISGKLYKECKQVEMAAVANNDELQEQLWDASLKWLDIKEFGTTD